MGVTRYPLESENACRVAGEHAGNPVNDGLSAAALEASARKTLPGVPAAAQRRGTRVAGRGLASVQEKLSAAFWAVKYPADPVGRPRHRPAALVSPGVRHISGKHFVRAPPQRRTDYRGNLMFPCLGYTLIRVPAFLDPRVIRRKPHKVLDRCRIQAVAARDRQQRLGIGDTLVNVPDSFRVSAISLLRVTLPLNRPESGQRAVMRVVVTDHRNSTVRLRLDSAGLLRVRVLLNERGHPATQIIPVGERLFSLGE